MARLRFNAELVKRLMDHAAASKLHRASYEQAYKMLGKDWFDGKVSAETLRDRIAPALHFVKDSGIYLMSNGEPSLSGAELGQGAANAVVYADGYDPKSEDCWERSRDAVGGDDFVENLDLSDLPGMPPGARFLEVNVSPKKIAVSWVAGLPPRTARPVSKKTKVH
jgi:hypothetical protein